MSSTLFLILRPEFCSSQPGQDPQKSVPIITRRSGTTNTTSTGEAPTPGKEQTKGKTPEPSQNSLWMIIAMFAVLYFVMIRPQQKQEKARRALIAAVSKGDKIVTNSGMHGTVSNLTEDRVILRVDKDIKLTFDRSAIGRKLDDEEGAGKS